MYLIGFKLLKFKKLIISRKLGIYAIYSIRLENTRSSFLHTSIIYIYVFSIKKEVFIKASEEIILAYPNERVNVYFVPGTSSTKYTPKTLHTGKLWCRYNNIKAKLGPYTEKNEIDKENTNSKQSRQY